MASKEANKAKYQYNKKYMEAYWERKAQNQNGTTTTTTRRTVKKQTTILSIFEQDFPMPELEYEDVTVCRNGKSDERYIKALELANKCLSRENKRLIQLLRKHQNLIRQSVADLYYEQ